MIHNSIITTRKKCVPLMRFINLSKRKSRNMIPRRKSTRAEGIEATKAQTRRAATWIHAQMKILIENRTSSKNNSTMTMDTKKNMQMRSKEKKSLIIKI